MESGEVSQSLRSSSATLRHSYRIGTAINRKSVDQKLRNIQEKGVKSLIPRLYTRLPSISVILDFKKGHKWGAYIFFYCVSSSFKIKPNLSRCNVLVIPVLNSFTAGLFFA